MKKWTTTLSFGRIDHKPHISLQKRAALLEAFLFLIHPHRHFSTRFTGHPLIHSTLTRHPLCQGCRIWIRHHYSSFRATSMHPCSWTQNSSSLWAMGCPSRPLLSPGPLHLQYRPLNRPRYLPQTRWTDSDLLPSGSTPRMPMHQRTMQVEE